MLSKAVDKERPSMFPQKRVPYGNTQFSKALRSISLRVTSKGALSPGSSHRTPSERDALFLGASFIHLSPSPVYEPPSRFPNAPPPQGE
jgi:hypothetical protein